MLVGPTGGGKTVILQTLVKAQTNLGLPTKLTIVNPKVSHTKIKIIKVMKRCIKCEVISEEIKYMK